MDARKYIRLMCSVSHVVKCMGAVKSGVEVMVEGGRFMVGARYESRWRLKCLEWQ